MLNADADGYTLMVQSASHAANPAIYKTLPYDPLKDIVDVALLGVTPYVMIAAKGGAYPTLKSLIEAARAKPGEIPFASAGVGTSTHMAAEYVAQVAGIKMLHIPYKGTGPAVTDLLGGRIDMMFAPGPVVQQFVQSGQLKALGVTDTQRSRFYPDVPTVSDSVPGYESVGWFGLLAPPNTPPEIVKAINEVIVAAMATPEFRDHLATLGAEPKPQTPEEFGRYINADVAKWSKLVKDNDVQLPGGK
jgi:tripartite-type tricarboxylate transporter receptor subunit TctC